MDGMINMEGIKLNQSVIDALYFLQNDEYSHTIGIDEAINFIIEISDAEMNPQEASEVISITKGLIYAKKCIQELEAKGGAA